MELKATETEGNLVIAFAGESQARNRYLFFAKKAKKEGYVQISALFEETADQEKAHASRLFKLMQGGEIEIAASFPAGPAGTTLENLRAAAGGEAYEYTEMYPEFARVARGEGFDTIAMVFEGLAVAEKYHGDRFAKLADNIEQGLVFKREASVIWVCRHCGFIHEGIEAMAYCPACAHPQAHFEIAADNF